MLKQVIQASFLDSFALDIQIEKKNSVHDTAADLSWCVCVTTGHEGSSFTGIAHQRCINNTR